jgi:hypothetical protein
MSPSYVAARSSNRNDKNLFGESSDDLPTNEDSAFGEMLLGQSELTKQNTQLKKQVCTFFYDYNL